MRNILQRKNSKKSKRSRPSKPEPKKKITRAMKLTDLQNVAKKKGIRFVGLTKNELYKELINYGVIHA